MSTTPHETHNVADGSLPSPRVIGTGFYRDAKPGTFGRSEWLDLLMACQDGRATCMRALEIIEREMELQKPSPEKMANAFLRCSLPASVSPDACVMDVGYPHRTGTNILTYEEAKVMMARALDDAP